MARLRRLDEAERAARELLVRHPYVHDGYDWLGMVYESRGQKREATDCYRKVIDFVRGGSAYVEICIGGAMRRAGLCTAWPVDGQ